MPKYFLVVGITKMHLVKNDIDKKIIYQTDSFVMILHGMQDLYLN